MGISGEVRTSVAKLSACSERAEPKTEVPCVSHNIIEGKKHINRVYSFLIWAVKSLPTSYCLARNDKQVSLPTLFSTGTWLVCRATSKLVHICAAPCSKRYLGAYMHCCYLKHLCQVSVWNTASDLVGRIGSAERMDQRLLALSWLTGQVSEARVNSGHALIPNVLIMLNFNESVITFH